MHETTHKLSFSFLTNIETFKSKSWTPLRHQYIVELVNLSFCKYIHGKKQHFMGKGGEKDKNVRISKKRQSLHTFGQDCSFYSNSSFQGPVYFWTDSGLLRLVGIKIMSEYNCEQCSWNEKLKIIYLKIVTIYCQDMSWSPSQAFKILLFICFLFKQQI